MEDGAEGDALGEEHRQLTDEVAQGPGCGPPELGETQRLFHHHVNIFSFGCVVMAPHDNTHPSSGVTSAYTHVTKQSGTRDCKSRLSFICEIYF